MKKLLLTILICLFVLCLTLPCFADRLETITCFGENDKKHNIDADSYVEYKLALVGKEIHDDFVPYEHLAFLGEFSRFQTLSSTIGNGGYFYYLIPPDGVELMLAFNCWPADGILWKISDSFLQSAGDMRQLNMERLLKEDFVYNDELIDVNDIKGFYIRYDRFTKYHYNMQGALNCIELEFINARSCLIYADFYKCSPDSRVGRLLSKRTASQAALEMQLHLNKPYEKNWKQPLTICLSAIGGAVVATLITFLVMRKKRGKPVPAVVGVPTGEVSAGSDGDASAAPAAPESPTPPEAASTDDKAPEETPPPDN